MGVFKVPLIQPCAPIWSSGWGTGLPFLGGERLPVLLDIPNVDGHDDVTVEFLEQGFQFQGLLGGQKFLHKFEGRNEQHGVAMAQDKLPAQGGHKVTFPPAWQAKGEQVVAALHKAPFQQRG